MAVLVALLLVCKHGGALIYSNGGAYPHLELLVVLYVSFQIEWLR
jgi:hypothetical protein